MWSSNDYDFRHKEGRKTSNDLVWILFFSQLMIDELQWRSLERRWSLLLLLCWCKREETGRICLYFARCRRCWASILTRVQSWSRSKSSDKVRSVSAYKTTEERTVKSTLSRPSMDKTGGSFLVGSIGDFREQIVCSLEQRYNHGCFYSVTSRVVVMTSSRAGNVVITWLWFHCW